MGDPIAMCEIAREDGEDFGWVAVQRVGYRVIRAVDEHGRLDPPLLVSPDDELWTVRRER